MQTVAAISSLTEIRARVEPRRPKHVSIILSQGNVSGGNDFGSFVGLNATLGPTDHALLPSIFSLRISTISTTRPDRDWGHVPSAPRGYTPLIIDNNKKLSCRKETVRLLHNSEIRILQ